METPAYKPTEAAAAAATQLLKRATSLRLSAVTADLVSILTDRGIEAVLLRGPVIADRLYDGAQERTWSDCDLLVAPRDRDAAEDALRSLGFEPWRWAEVMKDPNWHALPWLRPSDAMAVDLHRTIRGAYAPPAVVWSEVRAVCGPRVMHGAEVLVPSDPAIALVVALHVAEHGPRWSRPQDDLARALDRFPLETWGAAAQLAARIDAEGALRAGLSRLDRGAEIAAGLGLARPTTETILLANAPDGLSVSLQQIASTKGVWKRCARVVGELFPSRPSMHRRSGGRVVGGLTLARLYLRRLADIARRLPRAARTWWRARKSADDRRR